MSVSFYVSTEPTNVRGVCDLCDGTGVDFNAPWPQREQLRANPFAPVPAAWRCEGCRGTTVMDEPVWPEEPVNLNNQNARLVCEALGLPDEGGYGSVAADEVHQYLRRGIFLANSPGAYDALAVAPSYTAPGGHTTVVHDGAVARIVRTGPAVYSCGIAAEGVALRVRMVLGVLRRAAELGVGVHWG